MFLDYYGMPYAETYMRPLAFMIDIPFRKAAVAGDGDAIMACIYTKDVGLLRCVAA